MFFDPSKVSWRADTPSYFEAKTAVENLSTLGNSLTEGLKSLKTVLQTIGKDSHLDYETANKIESVLEKIAVLPQKLNSSGCSSIHYKHLANTDQISSIAIDFADKFDEICRTLPEAVLHLPDVSDSIKATRASLLETVQTSKDLKTFIDAQKHIILGFTPYLKKLNVAGSPQGVYWRYWTPQGSHLAWGAEFAARIDFINNSHGSIIFCYGDPKDKTNTLCMDRAENACTILSSLCTEYKGKIIESNAVTTRGSHPGLFEPENLYDKARDARYRTMGSIYQKFETKFNGIYKGKGGNGVKTYFELAYLLCFGVKFTMCGTETQKNEFHEMINKLDSNKASATTNQI